MLVTVGATSSRHGEQQSICESMLAACVSTDPGSACGLCNLVTSLRIELPKHISGILVHPYHVFSILYCFSLLGEPQFEWNSLFTTNSSEDVLATLCAAGSGT